PNTVQVVNYSGTPPECTVFDPCVALHPELCKCNRIVSPVFGCPDDSPAEAVPTDVFCQPGPGRTDPSVLSSSLATYQVSLPIPITLDPTQSSATVTIDILGESATKTRPVHGTVTFYGKPCPGRECDLLMDLSLFPEDFVGDQHFHYPTSPDVYLSS